MAAHAGGSRLFHAVGGDRLHADGGPAYPGLWLVDRFGTRRIYLAAISLFTLGSLACAASGSLSMLMAARVLQGIGGALLMQVYDKWELLGPLMVPALGGWLVEVASWHRVFLINLPVGVIGFMVSWYFMPDLRQATARFDWLCPN